MRGIKKFLIVYLLFITIASLLISRGLIFFQNNNGSLNFRNEPASARTHFSVRYRGFLPAYDNSYPDYYVAINNLAASTMQMSVRLFIQNQESSGYYFEVDKNGTPPSGWTINPYQLGQIPVDGTKDFVYSQMWRIVPTSISAGELIETVYLAVRAYYDSSYMNLYSQDFLNITYHFIDYKAAVWTTLYQDTFDDGTTQGWSGGGVFEVSTAYYRSFRYSLCTVSLSGEFQTAYYTKTFSVPPQYSEAYLILAIRCANWAADFPTISLDGTLYFRPDMTPSNDIWYQFVIPLHAGSTVIRLDVAPSNVATVAYMDDAYVFAK
jgi:hypothetical protein